MAWADQGDGDVMTLQPGAKVPNMCDEDLPVPWELRSRDQLRGIVEVYPCWLEVAGDDILVGRGDQVTAHRREPGNDWQLVTARYHGDVQADLPAGTAEASRPFVTHQLSAPDPSGNWIGVDRGELCVFARGGYRLVVGAVGVHDLVISQDAGFVTAVNDNSAFTVTTQLDVMPEQLADFGVAAVVPVVPPSSWHGRAAELRHQPAVDVVEELLRPARSALVIGTVAGLVAFVTAAVVGHGHGPLLTTVAGLGHLALAVLVGVFVASRRSR